MSACPLCGSAKTSNLSRRDRMGRRVRSLLCEDCGLAFNTPIPSARTLIEAYVEEQGHLIPAGGLPDLARTVRILARIERAVPEYMKVIGNRRRLLDACAMTGEFAFVMERLGFDVTALEPSPAMAAFCRKELGLDVEAASVFDKAYLPGSFEIIRVFHLLSHSPDPVGDLRKFRQWLTDDGLLYLELPNIEGEANFRGRGEIFDFGHPLVFNPVTLRAALATAGFEEAPQTVGRHRDTTAGFFRKCAPRPFEVPPANARRVSDAITRNYSRNPAAKAIGRLVDGLTAKAADLRDLKGLSSHREAAERFAQRLKARIASF